MRKILATVAAILALTGTAPAQTPQDTQPQPTQRYHNRTPTPPPMPKEDDVPLGDKWGPIGATGSDTVWFMKIAEMLSAKPDRFRQVWVKIDRSEEKGSTFRETHVLYALDCSQHGIQWLSWIDYNPNGTVATTDVNPLKPDGYQPVRPVTMSQAVEDSACGRRAWWYGPDLPDLADLAAG